MPGILAKPSDFSSFFMPGILAKPSDFSSFFYARDTRQTLRNVAYRNSIPYFIKKVCTNMYKN